MAEGYEWSCDATSRKARRCSNERSLTFGYTVLNRLSDVQISAQYRDFPASCRASRPKSSDGYPNPTGSCAAMVAFVGFKTSRCALQPGSRLGGTAIPSADRIAPIASMDLVGFSSRPLQIMSLAASWLLQLSRDRAMVRCAEVHSGAFDPLPADTFLSSLFSGVSTPLALGVVASMSAVFMMKQRRPMYIVDQKVHFSAPPAARIRAEGATRGAAFRITIVAMSDCHSARSQPAMTRLFGTKCLLSTPKILACSRLSRRSGWSYTN